MTDRFGFSEQRLRALKPPAEKRRQYVKDTVTPGLQLCVTSAGSKVYYYVRRIDGRPTRVRIGRAGEVTLATARKVAAEHAAEVARGKNPHLRRQQARTAPTLADLFCYWLQHAKQHKRTWRQDEQQYERFLARWSNRRLDTLKKTELVKWHGRIGEQNGRYAANRALDLLRAMLNKAGDIGYRGPNPAAGVRKFKEQSRDRFLDAQEVRALFEALAEETDLFRDFFLVCLLTGARRGNVAMMRWQDLDLDHAFWRIPDTKSGDPVVIPLSAPALAVLRTRAQGQDNSPWVFPSRSKTGHVVEPKGAWERIRKRAGLVDVRMHDLRRTLGSWQAIGGVSLQIIGRSLGHKRQRSTEVYARLTLDPVRQALDQVGEALTAAGGLLEGGGADDSDKE